MVLIVLATHTLSAARYYAVLTLGEGVATGSLNDNGEAAICLTGTSAEERECVMWVPPSDSGLEGSYLGIADYVSVPPVIPSKGLNNNGQVVIGFPEDDPAAPPWKIWSGGSLRGELDEDLRFSAVGINDAGVVFGNYSVDVFDPELGADNARSRAATWSGSISVLPPLFGENSNAGLVAMNNSNQAVGSASEPRFDAPRSIALWNDGGVSNLGVTMEAPLQNGDLREAAINNSSEIVLSFRTGPETRRWFLYLPNSAYGFEAGVTELTIETTGGTPQELFSLKSLNDRGELLANSSRNFPVVWPLGGEPISLVASFPTGNSELPFPTMLTPLALNNSGQVLLQGTVQGRGQIYRLSPMLDYELILSDDSVNVGEEFTMTLKATNISDLNVNLEPPSQVFLLIGGNDGGASTRLETLEAPVSLVPLAPNETKSLEYRFKALQTGSVVFAPVLRGVNETGAARVRQVKSVRIEEGTDPAISISVPETIYGVGETFVARITVASTGAASQTITFNPPLLDVNDAELADIETVDLPAPFVIDAQNPVRTFDVSVETKKSGIATLTSSIDVENPDSSVRTITAERKFRINPPADLLVNYEEASDANWFGNDVFQEFPIEPQRLESVMGLEDTTAFKLRVENEANEDKSYILKASETLGEGWNITYKDRYEAEDSDITELITSAGVAFEMPANSVLDFTIRVEATASATANEKGIIVTLADPDSPGETLDATEFVVRRSEILIEVNPRYPLVGHKATVSVHFINSTGETLTNVRPSFVVAETSIFAGGAEVELLTEDPFPPQIDLMADGEEGYFEYEFRMKSEGRVDFESVIVGMKEDGSMFESALGDSEPIDIGKVSVEHLELVQALRGVRLVGEKGVAMLVIISNTSPEPQTISFDKIVTTEDDETHTLGEISDFPPGINATDANIFSTGEEGVFDGLSPDAGEVEFLLFGGDGDVEDYPGRSKKVSYQPERTFPLEVAFLSLAFPPEAAIPPVPIEVAEGLRANHGVYLDLAFPMPPTEIPPLAQSEMEFIGVDEQTSEEELDFFNLLLQVEEIAILEGLDRLVAIFPANAGTWYVSQEGIFAASVSYPSLKHSLAVLGNEEVAFNSPSVTASTILDSFGFPETEGGPLIEFGFKIFRNSIEILENVPDLMQAFDRPDAWINEDQYEALIDILSLPNLDPEVLIVSGTINRSGEVTANAWYTGLTDQVTDIQTEGAYSVKFLDDQNTVISEHHFDGNFSFNASFPSGTAAESTVEMDISPFVFALPRPAELAKVEITRADQMLYEREVTPNAPVIESLTPLAGIVLQPATSQTINWTATDADGGDLETSISWSADGGSRWTPILFGSSGSSFNWTVPDQSTKAGYLRLRVTDGVNTTVRDEGPFTIAGSEPALIANSGGDLIVPVGQAVALDGSGSQATDDAALIFLWQPIVFPQNALPEISTPNGSIASWIPSTPGEYLFRLEVTDTEGRISRAYKRITVMEAGGINGPLHIRQLPDGRIELRWDATLTVNIERSKTLRSDSWSQLMSESEIINDERVLIIDPDQLKRFFRLKGN